MPTPALSTAWVPLWPVNPVAPPGEILDYAQIIANVSCAATSGATANLIVQGNSVTYDGSPIMIEFFAPATGVGATTWWLVLYDGNTQLGLLGAKVGGADSSGPVDLKVRLTPTPGVHAYNVRGFCATGALTLYAGTGAVGQNNPAFIRVSRDTALPLSTSPGVALSAPSYGTSFPLTPADGQEHILVDSLTAATFSWRFRYNAGSASAFKWEFIGGAPMRSEMNASVAGPGSAYADTASVGPQLTVPNAGDYELSYGAFVTANPTSGTRGAMSPKIGAAATVEADCVSFAAGTTTPGGTSAEASLARSVLKSGLAASTLIRMQYRNDGFTPTFDRRWLTILPRRVA